MVFFGGEGLGDGRGRWDTSSEVEDGVRKSGGEGEGRREMGTGELRRWAWWGGLHGMEWEG